MIPPILYAVGDVHGRADLLKALLAYIKADAGHYKARPIIYFLGDIVDRGMRSREALDLVKETLALYPGSRFHMGNHDWWFMDAAMGYVQDEDFIDSWLGWGGMQTLQSYYPDLRTSTCLAQIKERHRAHLSLIEQAKMYTERGKFIFVHAGVIRGKPLPDHDPRTFLFIREGFLEKVDESAAVVIHGHTIFEDGPIVTENRISLDTGAYKTNRLSACRIRPDAREITFIAAEGSHNMVDINEIEPKLLDRGRGTIYDRLDELFENEPFRNL